jgi:hypothetical protein
VGAAEQGDEADEAFGGMGARMDMPPHARAVSVARGHRFAAYPRCWADAAECEALSQRDRLGTPHLGVGGKRALRARVRGGA